MATFAHGTVAAKRSRATTHAATRGTSMTGFDDELDHVCAWGRWHSGDALNDATAVPDPGREPVRPREATTWTAGARARRGRRLRLVTDHGAATSVLRPVR
jgi:hypothetical protein